MKIKSIHLQNFQKHADLTIDFSSGVNVIYGKSDSGKSAIRRAIEWILFNEKLDGIRKVGTKQTVVTVTLDSNIEIEKVRSVSINRYILRNGKDEKIFDAIGKSVPEEIQEVIGKLFIEIDDEVLYLNSTPQIALPFLFDKSPTQRMKIFNQLTGNDLLDKLFVQLNKDLLNMNRNLRETKERLITSEKSLQEKEIEVDKIQFHYKKVKKLVQDAEALHDVYSKALEIKDLYEQTEATAKKMAIEIENSKVSEPIDVESLREKLRALKEKHDLINALESTERAIADTQDLLTKNRVNLPYKVEVLTQEIEGLKSMTSILTQWNDLQKKEAIARVELQEIKKELTESEIEKTNLIKQLKICPTCKQELTEDCLKEIINGHV